MGVCFSSGGFQVGPGESVGYWLSYDVDPAPAVIAGFGAALWIAPPVGGPRPIIRGGDEEEDGGLQVMAALLSMGGVSVDRELYVGGTFSGPGDARTCALGWTGTLSVHCYFGGSSQTWSRTGFGAPVSTVGVLNSIRLDGGQSGAVFWALDNQAELVAEPADWLLMGAGLVLVGLLALRRPAQARVEARQEATSKRSR